MDEEMFWGRRIRRMVIALVAGLSITVDFHAPADQYFMYFTVLTNILIGLWAFGASIFGDKFERRPTLRLALTVYGLVTLAVYWIFLAPNHHPQGLNFWANLGLHLGVPLAMALEGFLDPWPATTRLAPLWTIGFPLIYGSFILTAGEFSGWFPYFFLNPNMMGGWIPLGIFLGALLIGFIGISYGWGSLVQLKRRKATAE